MRKDTDLTVTTTCASVLVSSCFNMRPFPLQNSPRKKVRILGFDDLMNYFINNYEDIVAV